jgi:hypothetical protein
MTLARGKAPRASTDKRHQHKGPSTLRRGGHAISGTIMGGYWACESQRCECCRCRIRRDGVVYEMLADEDVLDRLRGLRGRAMTQRVNVRFVPVSDPQALRDLAAAIEGRHPDARRPLTAEGVERLAEIVMRGERPTIGFFLRYRRPEAQG